MSVEAILESIEKLTLLEAAELVKAMEEKFGVSAAAPVAVAAAPAAGAAEATSEAPSEVNVILASAGANKIPPWPCNFSSHRFPIPIPSTPPRGYRR